MLYLKAFVIGVATTLAAVAAWIVGTVALPLVAEYIAARSQAAVGSGGIGVSISASYISISVVSILLAAFLGFVAGFWWTVRRSWRRS